MTFLLGGGCLGRGGGAFPAVQMDSDIRIQVGDSEETFSKGLISFWTRQAALTQDWLFEVFNGTGQNILDVILRDTSSNAFRMRTNGGSGTHIDIVSGTHTPDLLWNHCLISFDTADVNDCHMYVNGVSDLSVTNYPASADTLAYTGANVGTNFQSGVEGVSLNGDVSELYINLGEDLDISILANREKFIKNNRPVYLGASGELPTGTSPAIYMHGRSTTFHENDGTFDNGGGNLSGVLTNSANLPVIVGT